MKPEYIYGNKTPEISWSFCFLQVYELGLTGKKEHRTNMQREGELKGETNAENSANQNKQKR
ncbi:hypothetical protein C7B71_15485 [Bacillus halotolerans]|nr:hypothetical protein C7B71_15485 [Bacillus halotolerans]